MTTTPHNDTTTQTMATDAVTTPDRRRWSLRGFTSLFLSLSFTVLCFSGVLLFLTPRGRTANWTDWSLLGLDKHQWGALHVNNSILFIVAAVLHLILNWSLFANYIKRKAGRGLHMKKEMALATMLAAVCIVGPIWSVPPFGSLMTLNEEVKNYWDRNAQQPPVPHAEEFTVAELAETIGLKVDEVAAALEEDGYQLSGQQQTIGEIAAQQGAAPSELFTALRAHFPASRGWGRMGGQAAHGGGPGGGGPRGVSDSQHGQSHELGAGPGGGGMGGGAGMGGGMGMGRGFGMNDSSPADLSDMTLAEIGEIVGLNVDELQSGLDLDPALATGKTTLGELANDAGQSPQELLGTIRQKFPDTRGWGRITGQRGGGRH